MQAAEEELAVMFSSLCPLHAPFAPPILDPFQQR